jgi:dihydrolipoamide dehydrogenase
MNEWTDAPEDILETFAADMRHNMLTYSVWSGSYALVIPKQLRELLVAAGWQKSDVREYIYRSARVFRRDWATVGKANIVAEGGLVKIVAGKDGGPVLGVHMVGPHVTDLVSEAMLAVAWEAVPAEVAALIHPHPTLSEGVGEAFLALAGKPLHGA